MPALIVLVVVLPMVKLAALMSTFWLVVDMVTELLWVKVPAV